MPVEMVAGLVQRSPLAVFTRATSGITSGQQLAGKTGGYAIGSAPETLFPAYAKATGLNQGSVTLDKVDVPTRDSLFIQGKTQFTFGLTNVTGPIMQATCKCKLNTLSYADAGLDVLSSGIVTSTSYAKGNAATLRKFLAATAEAIDFTDKNTDAAVSDFFKLAGTTTLSKEVVKEQWEATQDLMTTPSTSGQPFGCTAEADWQSTIKAMVQFGGVPAGKVTPASVASNAYLSGCTDTLGQA
jgi:NitT/TauT family transport system substrate-binding protein